MPLGLTLDLGGDSEATCAYPNTICPHCEARPHSGSAERAPALFCHCGDYWLPPIGFKVVDGFVGSGFVSVFMFIYQNSCLGLKSGVPQGWPPL